MPTNPQQTTPLTGFTTAPIIITSSLLSSQWSSSLVGNGSFLTYNTSGSPYWDSVLNIPLENEPTHYREFLARVLQWVLVTHPHLFQRMDRGSISLNGSPFPSDPGKHDSVLRLKEFFAEAVLVTPEDAPLILASRKPGEVTAKALVALFYLETGSEAP